MSHHRPHRPSGESLERPFWRRIRELWTIPATNLGPDADHWEDWLTSTRVLEDGINPSGGHRPRSTGELNTAIHDAPGVTA